MVTLAVILIFGTKFRTIRKTEVIILSCLVVGGVTGHYILQNSDFYGFYLYAAANNLVVVAVSAFVHAEKRVEHSRVALMIYGLLLFKFLLHMVLYRVRVITYDSDEPIMWLINGQSSLVLLCDFLILLFLAIKVSKWKLRYMHFS